MGVGVTGTVVESVIGVFAYILIRLEGSHACLCCGFEQHGRKFKIV